MNKGGNKMANFELRIFVIYEHDLMEVLDSREIQDTSELNDQQFVEVVEELGTVYSPIPSHNDNNRLIIHNK